MHRPLRGALIGFGFIMENGHGAAYRGRSVPGAGRAHNDVSGQSRADVRIEAIVDVSPARRALASRQFPGARLYADVDAMLAAEARNLDYVDIAAPPSAHASLAQKALRHDLHVLCEKPLATSVAEAQAMLDAARVARRVIYPCHNYKHAPVVKTVRRIIASGAIGKVQMVTLQTFRNTHARGVAEWNPDWRRERRYSGGGIAMDHGSHTFYLAFEWLGSYPTAITARMSTPSGADTEDDLSCSLRFPTGIASAHLSWRAGMRRVLYTIHGDAGAIRVEDDSVQVARLAAGADAGSATWRFDQEEAPSNWMDSSHVTWFDSLFDDFRAAIGREEWVGREAEEAFRCVQLIQTAYASAGAESRELPLVGHAPAGNLPETAPELLEASRQKLRLHG